MSGRQRCVRSIHVRNYIFLSALFLGLALATHPIAIWLIPGIVAAYVLAQRKPSFRELSICLGIIVACLSLYLYLPIRSTYVIDHHGDPTSQLIGTTGSIFFNYNDPSTWSGFAKEISGSQFGASGHALKAWSPARLQNYLWQWITSLNTEYGAFGIVLAFIGLQRLWRGNRRIAIVVVLFGIMAVPFSYAFANIEADPDRYRLLSYWLIPILMSCAALPLGGKPHWIRRIIVATLILSWGTQTFLNNRYIFNDRKNLGGRPLITEAALHIPQGAIVVAKWLDATSLAYGAFVDGSFSNRTIVAAWPQQDAAFYNDWARTAPVYIIAQPGSAPSGVKITYLGLLDSNHAYFRVVGR